MASVLAHGRRVLILDMVEDEEEEEEAEGDDEDEDEAPVELSPIRELKEGGEDSDEEGSQHSTEGKDDSSEDDNRGNDGSSRVVREEANDSSRGREDLNDSMHSKDSEEENYSRHALELSPIDEHQQNFIWRDAAAAFELEDEQDFEGE